MTKPDWKTWTPLPEAPIAELPPEFKPHKHPLVRVEQLDDDEFELDLGYGSIESEPDNNSKIKLILALADGTRTLAEIVQCGRDKLDTTCDGLGETMLDLYHLGVVSDAASLPRQGISFFHHVTSFAKILGAKLSETSPLSEALVTPARIHKRLLLGYLLEIYHVVCAASIHISPVINTARSPRTRMMFSEFLADEYWHGQWLEKGLLQSEVLSANDLARADPLPETQALINMYRCAAQFDPLVYAAILAMGEAQADMEEDVTERFDLFKSYQLMPDAVFEPFLAHEQADAHLDHLLFCREPYTEAAHLDRAEQQSIRRALLNLNYVYRRQYDAIFEFYGKDINGPYYFTSDPYIWTPNA